MKVDWDIVEDIVNANIYGKGTFTKFEGVKVTWSKDYFDEFK